jgi:hypothetical protein
MKNPWVLLVVFGALACQSKPGDGAAMTARSSAPAPGSAAAPGSTSGVGAKTAANGSCQSNFEYLVPLQKYGDSDLIRAITINAGQVFFRNMDEAFRVPLAGGTPTKLGKAPALSLSGTTVVWTSGDKLLTQSPGEPIFMSAAKTGGPWSNHIDLSTSKLGGGRDAATRILQGMGKQGAPQATQADFDGKSFYFAEITRGKGRNAPASSAIRSVALAGGEARTLYQAAGEIRDVTRAGEHLVFLLTAPPTPEQIKQNEAERKKKKYVFGVKGQSHLMSIPLAGGEARKLMQIGPFMSGFGLGRVVLGADGENLYASGYRDEDLQKPGIFRVDAAGGGVEEIDRRVLSGSAFVSRETLVLIGGGMIDPSKNNYGQLVLTAPRRGKNLTLLACAPQKFTLHASAVSDHIALLSLFEGDTQRAGIAKIALP